MFYYFVQSCYAEFLQKVGTNFSKICETLAQQQLRTPEAVTLELELRGYV